MSTSVLDKGRQLGRQARDVAWSKCVSDNTMRLTALDASEVSTWHSSTMNTLNTHSRAHYEMR